MEKIKIGIYPKDIISSRIISAVKKMKKTQKYNVGWCAWADAYDASHWFIPIAHCPDFSKLSPIAWFNCIKPEDNYFLVGIFMQPSGSMITDIELVNYVCIKADDIQLQCCEHVAEKLIALLETKKVTDKYELIEITNENGKFDFNINRTFNW